MKRDCYEGANALIRFEVDRQKKAGNGNALQDQISSQALGLFRNYGSDVANLTVAAAMLQSEIARRMSAGESAVRRR